MRAGAWLGAAALSMSLSALAGQTVIVYAAGSLRAPLGEAARAFTARHGDTVAFEFGPSGILRDRLARGERADVFASASMEHPQALAATGKALAVRMFARNRLCALVAAKARLTPESLLDRMLDPATRLGTSTPKADPSGDYAWQVFERAGTLRPGAFDVLARKALQLTGGPDSPSPPKDRNVYATLVAQGKADIFLTYCTNAALARREDASLAVVALPEELAVGADYGLAVMTGASAAGAAFADFLLGPEGQGVLSKAGFAPAAR